MKINMDRAISHFYSSPSFEQVYFETVANAIDAGAKRIAISIDIESYAKPNTLKIDIEDDGEGFTDRNFEKFSHLLEADSPDYKGLGRLVLLVYFQSVRVVSSYGPDIGRIFTFSKDFAGTSRSGGLSTENTGTKLECRGFLGERIKSYNYLIPSKIKERLREEFLPILIHRKLCKKPLSISIELSTTTPSQEHDFYSQKCDLSLSDVPNFQTLTFQDDEIDLIETISIDYCIENNKELPKRVLAAFCVDGRALSPAKDMVPASSIPEGYQLTFLFSSKMFTGCSNDSRQSLDISRIPESILYSVLRREVALLIDKHIETIRIRNAEIDKTIRERFPHLAGYFPTDTIGIIQRDEVIENAQRKFFSDQKSVLDCVELDDEKFEKALEVSSRVLMEYILHRNQIIHKLQSMDKKNSESDIHSLIVPQRRTFRAGDMPSDIYNNNVWILDDKYMSYTTVLSDEKMSHVLSELCLQGEAEDKRPDITLVFSENPDEVDKVDVVLVELKKHGVGLAEKERVYSQLRERARRLLVYYPDKINRIWFYGITDIDDEFSRSLRETGFRELFSYGKTFYKQQEILPNNDSGLFFVDMYILTYETLLNDAERRNATFLRLLKERMRDQESPVKPNLGP